jgi:hypothetical protein
MGAKYFTFCELGKSALRPGGANVSQVCVLLVAHEVRKTVRGRVEQSIQRLALPLIEGRMSSPHPEASLLQQSIHRAHAFAAGSHYLFE